jgi:hypothetical protein
MPRGIYNREQRERHPVRYLFNQARYRAKIRGIEFSLKFEDLEIPEKCPIMNIPLFFTKGRRSDNSYSIDRVDNSKGYTPENTRVISWLANGRKGDLTVEQICRLYDYIYGAIL